MRIILVIVLCVIFSGLCFAEEVKDVVKPAEPTEISITNEEKLVLENAQLKIQVLQGQIQAVQGQLDLIVKQLIAKYKIEGKDWQYDPVNGKFVKTKMQGENLKE